MARDSDLVAGGLIAQIRRESGLSQAQLARRSGLPASVLSAYAHNRRQPSVAALARIAEAGGMELSLAACSRRLADQQAGEVLAQVLDLAEALPARPRRELGYPPLIRIAA